MSSAARKDVMRDSAPLESAGPDDEFGAFLSDVSRELEALATRIGHESVPESSDLADEPEDLDPWFLDSARFYWDWVSFDERVIEEPR